MTDNELFKGRPRLIEELTFLEIAEREDLEKLRKARENKSGTKVIRALNKELKITRRAIKCIKDTIKRGDKAVERIKKRRGKNEKVCSKKG